MRPFQSVTRRGGGLLPGPEGRFGFGRTSTKPTTEAPPVDAHIAAPEQMQAELPKPDKPGKQLR